MKFIDFAILVGIVAILMVVYKNADRFIKKLNPETVKKINWAGFLIGVAGGIAWYALHNGIFMFITLFGIVIYFLFYGYDQTQENS